MAFDDSVWYETFTQDNKLFIQCKLCRDGYPVQVNSEDESYNFMCYHTNLYHIKEFNYFLKNRS